MHCHMLDHAHTYTYTLRWLQLRSSLRRSWPCNDTAYGLSQAASDIHTCQSVGSCFSRAMLASPCVAVCHRLSDRLQVGRREAAMLLHGISQQAAVCGRPC
jgi:hypothetical protein